LARQRIEKRIWPSLPDPENTSERLLDRVGELGVPVDVNCITKLWSNLSIVEEDIDGPGYLLPLGRIGGEIIVKASDPIERKRFTVAHEIGHWVLGITLEHKTGEFTQPPGVGRAIVEQWCDSFAASFLIPRQRLIEHFRDVHDTIVVRHLMNAPKRFRVSDEALFIRTFETLGMRIAFVGPDKTCNRILKAFFPENLSAEFMEALDSDSIRNLLDTVETYTRTIELSERTYRCGWNRIGHGSNIFFIQPLDEDS
jgi:hypothetical protein